MSKPSRRSRSPREYRVEHGAVDSPSGGKSPALDMAMDLFNGATDHSADDDYGVRPGRPGRPVAFPHDPRARVVHLGRPTAGTLPRLRDQVVTACGKPYTAAYIDGFLDGLRRDDPRQVRMLTRVNMRAADVVRWLRGAGLFFVSDEMTAMCSEAAHTMPVYNLRPDDVPTNEDGDKIGFMVWGAPVVEMDAARAWSLPEQGEAWCDLRAVLWAPCETVVGPGVLVTLWADTARLLSSPRYQAHEVEQPGFIGNIGATLGPLACFDAVPLPYGIGVDRVAQQQIKVLYQPIAAVLSTWLIMRQRIAVTTRERADRPVRLEYRAARRPEPSVRHITLRRTYTVDEPSAEPKRPGRVYHHRWPVVGHWRFLDRERYPDKTPTWVAPCERGPKGAPLIRGERVSVLSR